jgi:hypothetical protein
MDREGSTTPEIIDRLAHEGGDVFEELRRAGAVARDDEHEVIVGDAGLVGGIGHVHLSPGGFGSYEGSPLAARFLLRGG